MEIFTSFSVHSGPRYQFAGLRIEIHGNQAPGIYFKVEPSEEGYRRGIEKGLRESANLLGPNFLKTGSIWVLEIQEHPIDSSEMAFYRVARMAVDQVLAYRRIVQEGMSPPESKKQ
jgi:hypothetical protein